jgi:membrane associated rhomboid family serine protease
MTRTIALATLVAGTLDILFAMILTLIFGREIPAMLRTVASGPFPAATDMGTSGAILGLVVHFALMGIMAAVFVAVANHKPDLTQQPIKWGVIYGLVTYVVMNLVVVPLRFGNWPPKPLSIATQLFAHIVLVGIPIALITARSLRPRQTQAR